MIQLTNTLSGKKEPFTPIHPGKVSMYHCGPTVYDDAHIGNLRAFILADLLRRTMEFAGFEVTQIMNVTDIGLLTEGDAGEDKMVKGLKREGMPISLASMKELGEKYTSRFLDDLDRLNIKRPTKLVPASSEIDEQIEMIKTLEHNGCVYICSDGVYFDTSKYDAYGVLGGIDIEGLKEGARIAKNPEKKHPTDFALWKFNSTCGFDSPWGKGSPGWHIECSAISKKYLGETFDIHTGGIDLIPIHHNNEIAQGVCATGHIPANVWLHNAFVQVPEGKMSKSEGTGITLKTLEEKGIPALAYRYWLLTAHYRSPVSFSFEIGLAGKAGYVGILESYADLLDKDCGVVLESYENRFKECIFDDLDTPQALALLHELLRDPVVSSENKRATVDMFDTVLGLRILETTQTIVPDNIPQELEELVNEREIARGNKDWGKADELRDKALSMGFELRDTYDGTRIFRPL